MDDQCGWFDWVIAIALLSVGGALLAGAISLGVAALITVVLLSTGVCAKSDNYAFMYDDSETRLEASGIDAVAKAATLARAMAKGREKSKRSFFAIASLFLTGILICFVWGPDGKFWELLVVLCTFLLLCAIYLNRALKIRIPAVAEVTTGHDTTSSKRTRASTGSKK